MSQMTGRERIHAALKGEPVDRIPFAINAWQWFYAHKYTNRTPAEYSDCDTPLEFHKKLGADILTRWDGQIKGRAGLGEYVKFPNCRYTIEEYGEPLDRPITTAFNSYNEFNRVRRTLETPEGTTSQVWRFVPEACADFEEEHWISDFEKQKAILRFFVQDRSYDMEMPEYQRDLAVVGDHGVIMIEIPENPIKMLHWLMGPERATLAIMDFEDECTEVFDMHTKMTLRFIDDVCEMTTYDNSPLLMSNDNLDAMLMPPYFFDMFLYKHYKKVSQRIHDHARLFAVHSCGNNWDIRHCIQQSGIDMMEGLTPPPLGNFPLHLARTEIGENFIVEGGMFCQYQEMKEGAKEAIDEYTKNLFDEIKDTPRFIYASSCNTSPNTPIDNIHYFRDFCFKYGARNSRSTV